jgi:voltage-gated potassium channel
MGPTITMEQVRVTPKSEFVSKTLGQMLRRRDPDVIVLAIRKSEGEMLFNPPLESEISAGDSLIVLGERASLQKLEQILTGSR